MPSNKKICEVSPIVKRTVGKMYTFKFSFNTEIEAQKFRKAFIWWVEDERYKVRKKKDYNNRGGT